MTLYVVYVVPYEKNAYPSPTGNIRRGQLCPCQHCLRMDAGRRYSALQNQPADFDRCRGGRQRSAAVQARIEEREARRVSKSGLIMINDQLPPLEKVPDLQKTKSGRVPIQDVCVLGTQATQFSIMPRMELLTLVFTPPNVVHTDGCVIHKEISRNLRRLRTRLFSYRAENRISFKPSTPSGQKGKNKNSRSYLLSTCRGFLHRGCSPEKSNKE